MSNQFQLMREQRFRPFFFTQFLGAFNDNVFKTALITLVTFHTGQLTQMDGKTLATLLPGLFILPFFLFSATCGQIADKYEKGRVARAVKLFEIGVMLLAAWGFVAQLLWPLVAALFLMGLHSTLFGPVKYAYLPQQLRQDELVGGNGMIEMGTFVAILLGQIGGAWLATRPQGGALAALTVVGIAVLGYQASRAIPLSPAADPQLRINWNPLTETWRNLVFVRGNRTVWLSILGISWFWFYGATILAQFPNYAREVLGGDERVFILLLAVFSFGVGSGSLLCEKLSGRLVEIGLVPFGAIGLTLFGVDLYFASPSATVATTATTDLSHFLSVAAHWRVLADIALIGLFGGFYIVPMYALIQTRSEPTHQSRVIAANNIMNALFMVASAGLSMLAFKAGLTIPELFLATALFNAVVAIYIYTLVPEYLLRFIFWILIHSVYRLKKDGIEHIPAEGAALLTCNHVSFVDALIISAACPRPIRFIMDHRIFKMPLLSFIFRESRAIPIAPAKENPQMLEQAYAEVARALAAGDLVCIFPEGAITWTGEVGPFKNGVTRILESTPVPVIPLALRGLWQSFFSRKDGPAMTHYERFKPFRAVRLLVGTALPPTEAQPEKLRELTLAMRGKAR
ncbi:MAG: MFS transporter [Sterolibacterium sp.]|jgi:1-acyl-sn-glycerol-3-phosphate acyltransferase|nr:MFS transporter [Sterolibacterium sp.]